MSSKRFSLKNSQRTFATHILTAAKKKKEGEQKRSAHSLPRSREKELTFATFVLVSLRVADLYTNERLPCKFQSRGRVSFSLSSNCTIERGPLKAKRSQKMLSFFGGNSCTLRFCRRMKQELEIFRREKEKKKCTVSQPLLFNEYNYIVSAMNKEFFFFTCRESSFHR